MKKLFSIFAAVLFAGSMMAEGLLFEQTYPGTPSAKAAAYTKTFTLTTDGYTLTYANINNGSASDSWDAVRAGRKDVASVATVTSAAIAEKVSRVTIDFTQVLASSTNELYLQVADNANFTSATKISATIAMGEVSFEVATPAVNMFYQIVLDMEGGSANGFNRWDKIQFITPEGGTPIVVPTYDTLTVAQAKEIADTLAENASSKTKYYVEGYAVHVDPYSELYHSQIFFMVDDFAAPDSTFQAYSSFPSKDGEVYQVLAGDKVRAFGAFKKFVQDGKTQLELVNPTVEFIEEVEGDRTIKGPDTINVAKAVELASALAEPEAGKSTTMSKEYIVKGYAVTNWAKNNDGTWSFGMSDEINGSYEFQASNCTADADVAKNDFMYVRGQIAKRKTNDGSKIQLQIYKGTAKHEVEAAPDTISAADAKTMAEALEVGAYSPKVVIDCYIAKFEKDADMYDAEHGNASPWLGDDPTSTYGQIKTYRAKVSAEDGPTLAAGDHVQVVGRLSHTVNPQDNTKHYYQVAEGAILTVIEKAQGIENVVLTEQAQKVMVDGVVYIIRDNKMFNVMGTQVR